ncbi:helix-turn-helix transcriptional regulator [Roseovarius sp. 2305UL8-3]|uniref:helix-turn-helix transcriptional regulator n=1 Tax=Roseovarius conchicola TaxID=3121636 RepID=UPI003528C1F2
MTDDRTQSPSPDCLAGIARAIELIGQDDFLPALTQLCLKASGYDNAFVAAYFPDHPPVELFDNLGAAEEANTITPYLDFAYLLDPFYTLYQRGIGDNVIRLRDCAPDDFLSSEYYQAFYAGTGLYDEAGVFVAFEGGASIILSLGSRVQGAQMNDAQYAALTALLPCVAALCRRHWPRLDPGSLAGSGRIGLHLEKSFERFGRSVLSDREAEIVRLILKGHSSKSIARELGNSPETVKVHRKRIHTKLGIASQGELFSMFLDALSRTPPNAQDDPLSYLANDNHHAP